METQTNNISLVLNQPIANLTTYKTQGNIHSVAYPTSKEECINLIEFCKHHAIDFFVIGNGSNLLISPQTRKICINLSKMKEKVKIKNEFVTVSSQCKLYSFFAECKKHGLGGISKVCTIPGCVGGTLKNNASFMDESLSSKLEWIDMIIDGKRKRLKKKDLHFSYRKSDIPKGIILSAKFCLQRQSQQQIHESFMEAISHRNQVQAKGFSCGCVFKNPPNASAGQLIEKCGLKGKTKGGAIISPQHCNFIINQNNATFEDVKYLIEYAKEEVERKFNIILQEEVEIIE